MKKKVRTAYDNGIELGIGKATTGTRNEAYQLSKGEQSWLISCFQADLFIRYNYCCSAVPSFNSFRKKTKKVVVVTAAAMISETGSAKNTAKTLSVKKLGRIKIMGISRMTLRSKAMIRLILACPRAMNAC